MKKTLLFLFCLSLALWATAGSAMANLAANTEIINSAKLTYTGGTESATVSVTVALVPAQPNVSITNSTGVYTAPDTPALTNSVVITSAANGPVDYTVTPSVVAGAGTANSDSPSVTAVSTVSIGASVTTGTSGTTFVTVPASGASGNNAAVNGIGVTDTIVFTVGGNTTTKQVTSTTDNGDGTFRLNWTGAIPDAAVPAAGVQVGEQTTVTLSVLPGTVSTSGTDITVTVQAVVTTNGAADATATNSTPNTWTTPSSPSVSMDKYVRNITTTAYNPAVGGTPFTINGADRDYFTAGVTGKTGDTLEYVIVASSLAGGADLTGCAISDLIPEAFVTLKIGVYGVNNVFYIAPDGATSSYTAGAVGIQQASFVAGSNPNLIVNVGDGASNTLTGTIPVGQSVTIAYQVTIK
jgi:hypothetical protein